VPLERKLHLVHPLVDSFIEIAITENGLPVGSEGVIRCDLTFKRPGSTSVSFSSATNPTWFTLAFASIVNGRALNVIRVNLKDLPDPPANGRWKCNVTIRDALSVGGMTCGAFDVDMQRAGSAGSVGTGLPPKAFLCVCGQTVQIGSTNQAIITSADNGITWVAQTTPLNQTVKAMAQSMTRGGEILGLDTVGAIIRSIDGGATWALLTNNIGSFGWNDLIRHEGFGLYVASGAGGVVKTSPDGVTWTLRTTPNANGYTKMLIANDGAILAGSNSNITQPVMRSTDGGVTWALVAAFGFATDVQELTQSSSGRYMFGSRNNLSTVTTTDLLNFTQIDGTGATHNGLGYNAVLDLFAVSGSNGIYTSPGTGAPAWTVREASLPFQTAEDIISMQFAAGFIGIRPLAGAQTTHVIVRSLNGISWTSTTPVEFAVAGVYRRMYEFMR
jgi:hypothetical protein